MTIKKLHLNYIDQVSYLQGMHRSGWPFVMLNLLKLQNDHGILCDTYVDRTFLWGKTPGLESYIPYTVPWIGFIHHTFDTTFSLYNNTTLLKNENFLKSLPSCKGLFVFSTVAKKKWSKTLSKMGYNIIVTKLVHPTQFVSTRFSMTKFIRNDNKKIVQIGAWLRDNYAIYRLNNGNPHFKLENGTFLHKAAIIGPKMEHYYRPFDFFRRFRPPEWKRSDIIPSFLLSTNPNHSDDSQSDLQPHVTSSVNGELPQEVIIDSSDNDDICRDICRDTDIMCRDSNFGLNKYVKGAVDMLSKIDASVITFQTMSNEEYDEFLSENIVFLNLIDASAVNTLQECIVRNTPIVINPLPAIVEILGKDYPLYYENLDDIPDLISLDNIEHAYDYLVNMDKDSLRISNFLENITTSQIYQNI